MSSVYTMSDMNSKWDIPISMSELESLGLETPKLNELNDSYEVENLLVNLKQSYYQDYKYTDGIFTDWQIFVLDLFCIAVLKDSSSFYVV